MNRKIINAKRMLLNSSLFNQGILNDIDEVRIYKIPEDPKGLIRLRHLRENLFAYETIINGNTQFKQIAKLCRQYATDRIDDVNLALEDTRHIEVDLKSMKRLKESAMAQRMSRLKSLSESGELYKMDINEILREMLYATN